MRPILWLAVLVVTAFSVPSTALACTLPVCPQPGSFPALVPTVAATIQEAAEDGQTAAWGLYWDVSDALADAQMIASDCIGTTGPGEVCGQTVCVKEPDCDRVPMIPLCGEGLEIDLTRCKDEVEERTEENPLWDCGFNAPIACD